ncbi:MBL fold metallo-hydrolase [bacterium]|nr:MBL fold metallo-hydrolase [bacterium]
MKDFKVKFRGVRGSFPVADKKFLQYGGNTSCVEINAGGHVIILDAGTGIVKVGDELMEKYISSALEVKDRTPVCASVLLSHIHQDHILGLTFFKPMHLKSSKISIFGDGNDSDILKDNLSNLVFGKTFPLDLNDIQCELDIHNLDENYVILLRDDCNAQLVRKDKFEPQENDVVVTFYKSYVHPQNGVIIYKITYKGKSVVYATDKESYFGGDKKFVQFSKNCNLLIHDAQYTSEDYLNSHSPKQGFGHSTYDMALEAMHQTGAKNLVFFHYEPSYDDSKLDKIKELYTSQNKNVYMAYEGLELNIE